MLTTKISLVCLLATLCCVALRGQAIKLGAMLDGERLQELEADYQASMNSLSHRLAASKSSNKFSFAANDRGFMEDIRQLGSILRNMGQIKGRAAGETDMEKAAQMGLESGHERVFDEVMDAGSDLWAIPKVLEHEFKLRH